MFSDVNAKFQALVDGSKSNRPYSFESDFIGAHRAIRRCKTKGYPAHAVMLGLSIEFNMLHHVHFGAILGTLGHADQARRWRMALLMIRPWLEIAKEFIRGRAVLMLYEILIN